MKAVHNLSTYELTPADIKLLNKGLSFATRAAKLLQRVYTIFKGQVCSTAKEPGITERYEYCMRDKYQYVHAQENEICNKTTIYITISKTLRQ